MRDLDMDSILGALPEIFERDVALARMQQRRTSACIPLIRLSKALSDPAGMTVDEEAHMEECMLCRNVVNLARRIKDEPVTVPGPSPLASLTVPSPALVSVPVSNVGLSTALRVFLALVAIGATAILQYTNQPKGVVAHQQPVAQPHLGNSKPLRLTTKHRATRSLAVKKVVPRRENENQSGKMFEESEVSRGTQERVVSTRSDQRDEVPIVAQDTTTSEGPEDLQPTTPSQMMERETHDRKEHKPVLKRMVGAVAKVGKWFYPGCGAQPGAQTLKK